MTTAAATLILQR